MEHQYFKEVKDFRLQGRCLYKLDEILFISLCTIICYGEDFEDMVSFGEEKIDWLRQFVELRNGIPSHDTFNRVLQHVEPKCLREYLKNDGANLMNLITENHISFDEKR